MLELVVLISGAGSNLRALLDATLDAEYPARVVAIGADRDAEGLQLGEEYSIPTFTVPFSRFDSREEWGRELAAQIRPWTPDLLVLSGLMRLLPPAVVSEFGPAIINTHPAYLPEFPGAHGVRDALAAGVTETGASVIKVDDGVDSGPIRRRSASRCCRATPSRRCTTASSRSSVACSSRPSSTSPTAPPT